MHLDRNVQQRTRDITVHFPDRAPETRSVRPRGDGWRVLRDDEGHTVWVRHPTVRIKRRWLR
jgi:hypothetical protein